MNESLSIENTLWASTVIASGKMEDVHYYFFLREYVNNF